MWLGPLFLFSGHLDIFESLAPSCWSRVTNEQLDSLRVAQAKDARGKPQVGSKGAPMDCSRALLGLAAQPHSEACRMLRWGQGFTWKPNTFARDSFGKTPCIGSMLIFRHDPSVFESAVAHVYIWCHGWQIRTFCSGPLQVLLRFPTFQSVTGGLKCQAGYMQFPFLVVRAFSKGMAGVLGGEAFSLPQLTAAISPLCTTRRPVWPFCFRYFFSNKKLGADVGLTSFGDSSSFCLVAPYPGWAWLFGLGPFAFCSETEGRLKSFFSEAEVISVISPH